MTWGDLSVGDVAGLDLDGDLPWPVVNLGNLELFGVVHARTLLEEKYGGRELGWGSSGAVLDRKRILAFLREFETPCIDAAWRRTARDRAMELKSDRTYLLYAYENAGGPARGHRGRWRR